MAEGLAIVALIIALLCLVLVIALGCLFFRLTMNHEKLNTKLEDGLKRVIGDFLWSEKRLLALENEAKNVVDTGLYSPVTDKVTGKTELKRVDDFGDLQGLGFDEIMKRAQALADGKVANGRP